MTEHATKLANDHWQYIESLIRTYADDDDEIAIAKFHYISAFIHGYKHGQEDTALIIGGERQEGDMSFPNSILYCDGTVEIRGSGCYEEESS